MPFTGVLLMSTEFLECGLKLQRTKMKDDSTLHARAKPLADVAFLHIALASLRTSTGMTQEDVCNSYGKIAKWLVNRGRKIPTLTQSRLSRFESGRCQLDCRTFVILLDILRSTLDGCRNRSKHAEAQQGRTDLELLREMKQMGEKRAKK